MSPLPPGGLGYKVNMVAGTELRREFHNKDLANRLAGYHHCGLSDLPTMEDTEEPH